MPRISRLLIPLCCIGLCSSLHANPVVVDATVPTCVGAGVGLLAEVFCVFILFGITWRLALSFGGTVVAIHLVTFPLLLAILYGLEKTMPMTAATIIAESLIVIIEASVYYGYFRRIKGPRTPLRCFGVSFAGNIVSVSVCAGLLSVWLPMIESARG